VNGARRRLLASPPVWAAVLAFVGALAGARVGPRLATPEALDATTWAVVVPGLSSEVLTPNLGRGTLVADGVLELTPHAFGRADRVRPRDERPVATLEVELAPDSGPLEILLVASGHSRLTPMRLTPDSFIVLPDLTGAGPIPHGPTFGFAFHNAKGRTAARDREASFDTVAAGTFEMVAVEGTARVRRVRARAADGSVIAEGDWTAHGASPVGPLLGGLLGALAGLVMRAAWYRAPTAGRGWWRVALLALPPILICMPGHATWLFGVERLFLVRTPPWELVRWALLVSVLPLVATALVLGGILMPRSGLTTPVDAWPWGIVLGAVWVVAARDLGGAGYLWLVPGFLLVGSPVRLAARAGFDWRRTLLIDAPALVALGALGLPLGLLPAVLWRFVTLVAALPLLMRRAPGPGADALLLHLLLLPIAAEGAARATYLDRAWDGARLADESVGGESGWRTPRPFWTGVCGDGATARNVYYLGGSSVGGAYQNRGDPAGFFPGRVHGKLCESKGVSIRTLNFGEGGRDTFQFSRTIDHILASGAPSVVVAYLGVNDVLTQNSALTRKEREAAVLEQGPAARVLSAAGRVSRLVTGMGLLVRPVPKAGVEEVSDVPVEDADENLRIIASAVTAAGGTLVLAPELTDLDSGRRMGAYRDMERRLSETLPGVVYVDFVATFGTGIGDMLVDRNHLSGEGADAVAEELARSLASVMELGPLTDPG